MIIVTGAAGFIGSCLARKLNESGFTNLVLVDDFSKTIKSPNFIHKQFLEKVDRGVFFNWLERNTRDIDFIFHIGARTDTTEFNMAIFDELNLNYSKSIWNFCALHAIPMLYASSAATYGDGAYGYDDQDPELSFHLRPLNPYGISKNAFDKWAFKQEKSPPRWYGMKFFNVFGPNEYHKGRMASVVYHAFNQVNARNTNSEAGIANVVKLFRSHVPAYQDGGQLRDFIYVKDVIDVLVFLMEHHAESGLYNLGTGKARTFLDLATSVFAALNLPAAIEYIDIPEDIRDKYQYFTEAKMTKLRDAGYTTPFFTLEKGIEDYVVEYLLKNQNF